MADIGGAALGPVFRLVYRSRACFGGGRRDVELEAIFEVARSRNVGMGVTGALLAWQNAFVQVLEGDESAVRLLYDRIRVDVRHEHVLLLDADTVPDRVFGAWSMARVGEDGGADIVVPMDVDDPGPVVPPPDPGRFRRTTMLDLMCEYVRADVQPR